MIELDNEMDWHYRPGSESVMNKSKHYRFVR